MLMQLVPIGDTNNSQCFPGQNGTQGSEDLLLWLWESGALELALNRGWSWLWFFGVLIPGLSWLCSKAVACCRGDRRPGGPLTPQGGRKWRAAGGGRVDQNKN